MTPKHCASLRRERLRERGAIAAIAALLSADIAIAVVSLLHM